MSIPLSFDQNEKQGLNTIRYIIEKLIPLKAFHFPLYSQYNVSVNTFNHFALS